MLAGPTPLARAVGARPAALPSGPSLGPRALHVPVTAPSAADDTNLAYLAITPVVYRGGSGRYFRRRSAISLSVISTWSVRAGRSKVMMSPSRTAAIGP